MSRIRQARAYLTAALAGAAFAASAAAQDEAPIPDFSSHGEGWITSGPNFLSPPGGGPHQVTNDPNHVYAPVGRNEAGTFRVADLSNPILQPWAREELRKLNEKIVAGVPGYGYTRQVSCWPVGVPAFLLFPAQPLYMIQTPKEVVLMEQMDAQVRHVYLNVPHSKTVKPSWYGESVGHYEGDTLVVDTIGLNDQTWVDNYRTPHSPKLHVVERYHLIDGGKRMEVDVHIEDEGAYTMPWDTIQRYDRTTQAMLESICAENNVNLGDLPPMPEAKTPDF